MTDDLIARLRREAECWTPRGEMETLLLAAAEALAALEAKLDGCADELTERRDALEEALGVNAARAAEALAAASLRAEAAEARMERMKQSTDRDELLDRLEAAEAALAAASRQERLYTNDEMLKVRADAHGDGQLHAIADVNAGLVDDLIAPRLAAASRPQEIHDSIVTNQPGRPVAVSCALEGCHYEFHHAAYNAMKLRAEAAEATSASPAAPPAWQPIDERLRALKRYSGDDIACYASSYEWVNAESLDEILDAPTPLEWQPIETAPRDGTWFWVKRDNPPPSSHFSESVFKWDDWYGGWFSGTGWYGKDQLGTMRFTRWRVLIDQPLPSPPASAPQPDDWPQVDRPVTADLDQQAGWVDFPASAPQQEPQHTDACACSQVIDPDRSNEKWPLNWCSCGVFPPASAPQVGVKLVEDVYRLASAPQPTTTTNEDSHTRVDGL